LNLLGNVNLSVLLLDRNLRIRRFTPTARTVLNLQPTDIDHPLTDIALPVIIPDLKRQILEVMDTLKPVFAKVKGQDGSWYEYQIRPYLTDEKKIEGAVVAIADISELTERTADLAAARESLRGEQALRAGAEDLARAGEVRFRAIADSLPELISFVDAEQRYQFCNKSYEKSLGISPDEFKGRTVRDVLGEGVYPTFKPFLEKALAGQYASYEGYVSHEKFGRRYVHIDYIPHRNETGKVDGLYAVIRNLTELKEAEEKFRAFVETAPQAIIIHDATGKIAVVNSEAERMFGYPRQELIGQPIEILMPSRFRGKHVELRQAYMKKPVLRPMGAVPDLFAQRKDGSEFPVEISLSPVDTAGGILVSSTIIDITDRKQHEEQMRWATVLEERARMARDVHDTLAQGFTGIILNLEAAEEACADLPKEARDRITRARDVARSSLEEARRSVLAISTPSSANGELVSLIRELVKRYGPNAKTRLEFSIKGTAVPLDLVVEENLLRIAQQAVDNSLQHAHASSIHIELDYDKKAVRLQIIDNGQGFDIQKARQRLGLTGMRERAKEIGGKFKLDSKPGQGTRIEIVVPLSRTMLPEASR
jgi:two-component system, NarL family, sensor histidine kinase DevS